MEYLDWGENLRRREGGILDKYTHCAAYLWKEEHYYMWHREEGTKAPTHLVGRHVSKIRYLG